MSLCEVVECNEVSPEPPLLQTKQSHLPQLIRLVLQTLQQFCCSSLDMFQGLNVFLVVRDSKLNTILKVRPHLSAKYKGMITSLLLLGTLFLNAGQDGIGPLGHLGTLLARVQLSVNQYPNVLFLCAVFQPLYSKPVAWPGVVVTKVKDVTLVSIELHPTGFISVIQPVKISLSGLLSPKQIDTYCQLGVICICIVNCKFTYVLT